MNKIITDRKTQLMMFAVIILATYMDGFDETCVSVVLPTMASAFSTSVGEVSWAVTIYFLFMAALILIVGKVCLRGAIKKVLMSGFVFFMVGGAVAFLSPIFDYLLVARALQGMGSAMLWCAAIMMAVKYLPKPLVALGFAAATAGESIGSVAGPLSGGFIPQLLSWEWVFVMNIPLGVMALFFAWKIIPDEKFNGFEEFDFIGAVLLFISLFSGMYCIETAAYNGATLGTVLQIGTFVVALLLFLIRTRRVNDPLVDLSLFRNMGFNQALVIYVIVVACGMGISYINPFYVSQVLGYGSVETGLLLLIPGVVTLPTCMLSGKLVVRYGCKPFIILCCLLLLGMSVCYLVAEDRPLIPLTLSLFLAGILWAFSDSSISTRLVNSVPDKQRCACSVVETFFAYVAVASGCAFYFVMLTLGSDSKGIPIEDLSTVMFVQGFELAVFAGMVLCTVALILAVMLKKDVPSYEMCIDETDG